MDPVNLIGRPRLLELYLSSHNLSQLEKMDLLTIGLSIGCIESCKELIKFGADLERGILSKVLISWSNDEVDVEERLNLMTLLFENTCYEPTLEDQSNCSHHITLRLKLLLEKQQPKKLEYLSKISFRKNLIAYSNGQSIIQTIKESKIWPQPLLKRIYDIQIV